MVFRYLIASSCHFLNEWIRFAPLGASAALESGENDSDLCTWLIALVLIVLLISCSSNCIWGEITVLVNSSTLELCVMPLGNVTMSPNSPPRLRPAKSSAPEVFGLLVWSVTLIGEMRAPDRSSLNKLSFNTPKARFIEQADGRGKQKSAGRRLLRKLEGIAQIRSKREMCFGQILYDGEPGQTEVRDSGAYQSNLLTMGRDSSCQRKLQPGATHDFQRGLLSRLNAEVPCTIWILHWAAERNSRSCAEGVSLRLY